MGIDQRSDARQGGSTAPGCSAPSADAHRQPRPRQRARRALDRPPRSDRTARVLSGFSGQRQRPFASFGRREDLLSPTDLLTTGQVAPVIDRTYTLDEAADALRCIAAGHTRGKVVITV
ncbi:zinc-binding dehydrogenase [Microbacterium sp. LWH3-1.2]|uniref:zinc-binding dehydrogenase n=1 Tax=Microbacterium sp. LWH3-1.2 TaxID=3135256 RepID=UPI00343E6B14